MYDYLLVRHCNYSSILYRLRVIWRWILSWPWNVDYRSLKVIETGAIQKLGCGFLFAFYSNYSYLVSPARYSDLLVENREIFIPNLYLAPPQRWFHWNFVKMFDAGKTRMIGRPYGKKTMTIKHMSYKAINRNHPNDATQSKSTWTWSN